MKNLIFILAFMSTSVLGFSQITTQQVTAQAVFGNLTHDGPYDRSEILLQEEIVASFSDGNTYEIISYTVIIAPKKGEVSKYSVKGNKIPAKVQGALNQIVGEDKVLIESIFASVNGDNSHPVELAPIVLQVKKFEGNQPYVEVKGNNQITLDTSLHVTLGGLNPAGGYTLEDILEQTELLTSSSEGADYTITKFTMIIAYKNAPATVSRATGNKLTDAMLKQFANLKSGDRLIFEGIRSEGSSDGEVYRANLRPLVVTVL